MFSYVTAIKTKQRNRLSTDVLDTILKIRTSLYFSDKCCKDFIVTKRMINLFNSKEMYYYQSSTCRQDDDNIIETFESLLEYHRYGFFRDLFASPVPHIAIVYYSIY